jgi:DNA-binding beta-propeller fold protein YncE
MRSIKILSVFLTTSLVLVACKHEPFKQLPQNESLDHNYPEAVGKIIMNKCATPGCHNSTSYQISGGNLLLDSWEHLLDGGNTGASIIAYSPENSPLLYFTNAFPDLGPVPSDNMKMPLNGNPLTREEYLTLYEWVKSGAPDKDGNIPFASDRDTRQKIYLTHQGCDYVTVIDGKKHVIMRMIPVGKVVTIEAGHALKVAPDGNTGYVSFWATQYIQKIDTKSDMIIGDIDVTNPNSNMLFFSENGSELLVTNWYYNSLLRFNSSSGQQLGTVGSGLFTAPHGIALNKTGDTVFVTEQFGNMLYRIAPNGSFTKVSVDGNPPVASGNNMPGVHNIIMAPDHSKYFVTCEETNEVRVMDAYTDQLLQVISVGTRPQEMAISTKHPYIFVACVEDNNTTSVYKGSVYIIDYNTYQVVQKISNRYYLPHSLTVDDQNNMLYVFSRNIDVNGPVPHHLSASCGGRTGYYSVYDINKLEPLNNRRYEVTVDPYSADIRFK